MASIWRNIAVVELHKIRFSGFPAWAVWLFIHLMSIVGVKNRLFIFIDWMWSYFTYDPSLRLIIKPQPSKEETENNSEKSHNYRNNFRTCPTIIETKSISWYRARLTLILAIIATILLHRTRQQLANDYKLAF